ncbi:MAG: hypothetical protein ACYDAG_02460 [Chloroflexota bacterium]
MAEDVEVYVSVEVDQSRIAEYGDYHGWIQRVNGPGNTFRLGGFRGRASMAEEFRRLIREGALVADDHVFVYGADEAGRTTCERFRAASMVTSESFGPTPASGRGHQRPPGGYCREGSGGW